jgi:hypothetical protein
MHLSIPGFWRLNKAKYGLIGRKCLGCGKVAFPPREVCLGCGRTDFEGVKLSGSGQILSWTIIHVPPEGKEAPYTVALVKLNEGCVVVGEVVGDAGGITIGAPVSLVFRRLGENRDGFLIYGFKAQIK